LLPWLGRSVPAVDGSKRRNPFHAIDRWKILDNLRRSLVAPSMLLLALAGWLILPGRPWFWTLLAIFAPAGQLFTDLVSGLAQGRRRGAVRGLVAQLSDQAGRWFLAVVFLMHEAILSLHAILITLWRVYVSRRNLLEWTTAAHVAARLRGGTSRRRIWRQMWLGPAIAASASLALWYVRPESLPAALPLLLLWMVAPEITVRIAKRRGNEVEPLGASDATYLRGLARRTWFFFETFAGPEDNWLPPDNYQGDPHEEIAHRTSPTNIGMMLLSTATAWDFGYIGRADLAARTAAVFESLDRLERHRGHFFNWYDTRTLKPLEPRYVSAVDSGNLAVSLIAYAAALREAGAEPQLEPQRWDGIADVVGLLETAVARLRDRSEILAASVTEVGARLRDAAADPSRWATALGDICQTALPAIETRMAEAVKPASGQPAVLREIYVWMDRLRHQARAMLRDLDETDAIGPKLRQLADRSVAIAERMNFRPLYDAERRLFFIGHNVSSGRTDPHHYDLLASEARLASFFAIAKGDVPLEHWFHLERPVTRAARGLTLISWNGSMFEYLMPRLLLRSGPETLLGESERIAVEVQRRYGASNNVPWGISESAYAARDPEHRYRYQAFGVPGLGLRRGLARDMVVAPYASALALAVSPGRAAANLRALDLLAVDRRYGLVEAVDFTADRAGPGQRFTAVNAYMAHHQGMILCAIGNALKDDILVRRFAREPRMGLVSLLLSERIPKELPSEIERIEELDRPAVAGPPLRVAAPWKPPALAPFPQVNLLGNGRMSSWISEGGGGGLRWHRKALTRFLPDATRDGDGLWIYVADQESGALWSATRQPTAAIADEYQATFHGHAVEFQRRDHGIRLRLEVAIAAGDDLEIRRLSIANESGRPRRLLVTSYGEVVLAPPLEDERHPAFSKLFVVGESVPQLGGVLFTRRPRATSETPPVLLHILIGSEGPVEGLRFECDRRAFVGRGHDMRRPSGASERLGGSSGATLDSVMALQADVELKPFEQRELCFLTVAAASREAAIEVAERYATLPAIDWALGDAISASAHAVERLRLDPDRLPPLLSLASLLVHPHAAMRGDSAKARANKLGQSNLWGLAISGDHPILLLRTGPGDGLLAELIGAHQWWRRQGLDIDLVILQTGGSAYMEPMRDDIAELLRDLGAGEMLGRSGGVHLVFADQIGPQQVRLLEATARVVLDGSNGSLQEQLAEALETPAELPSFAPSLGVDRDAVPPPLARAQNLRFDNEIGGFTPDGREYVIHLEAGQTTPAPWANVLANVSFGSLVTEAGGGYSWAVNSGENRLTPWTNDPVADPPVETLYLRDEETAAVWSATPAPAARDAAFEIRHGAGYSKWRSRLHGVEQEMLAFVPIDAPVKIVRLTVRNLLNRNRRLTATYYAEWLLGALPSQARQHVLCSYDPSARALLARSWWNFDFAGRTAFLSASLPPHGLTSSRQEFLGREGDPALPAGLARWGLSGRADGGDGDPCAAYQVHFELAPGASVELVFVLGQGESEQQATELARKWTDPAAAQAAFDLLAGHWDALLGAVEVRTPEPGFDIIVNRWLLYQSLSSRILARTGFYQSSGAIGFRDQLQDVLALLHADPARARAHILRCAAHQFGEGDVLHWWHPPSDRGVRTRCSDDLLWLPYAVGTYVRATGDDSILAEEVAFLDAPLLRADEEDRYARYEPAGRRLSLIDHCERALEQGLTQGAHGLPLIGTGDWNDGMDRLGRGGRGESVWLAWFASVTAGLMADLQRRVGRDPERWMNHARTLRQRAEESGWDGGWYRRAYDDDGHPLGSAENDECRIDSISQSWAAFAEADPERVRTALAAAARELIDPEAGLARLLWPPFAETPRNPGYIKAYPPGVRENGGQYSHAAAWLGLAFARTGQADAAMSVFEMLNPIGRATDRAGAEHYRVEPYAVAGDIASAGPLRGRGGWTWYTGAASWTWRLGVEGILGIGLRDGRLLVNPCIPAAWGGFEAVLRRPGGTISLKVEDPGGIGCGRVELTVDGKPSPGSEVEFPTDGGMRVVVARIGA
jgi:cyclic beta-1,2-glucan synthetase